MKNNKIILIVLILSMIALIFSGCGGSGGITTPEMPSDSLNVMIITTTTSGEAPLEVSFDASESTAAQGNEIVSYEWDFGDGKTTEGKAVQHGFDSAGSYTVMLTISDNKGAVDTSSVIIKVIQPTETVKEQTFNALDGTEFDTGTGLVVSILPEPNGGLKKLVVTENLDPQQPAGESIKLQSVYQVSLSFESSSQEQGITPKNDIGINSKTILTFDIPSGVNPSDAMIITWTEEGWTVPFLENSPGAISAFGGEISADGKHISIGVTLTSKDYPDLTKVINQKGWWPSDSEMSDLMYVGVGHAFDNAMKAATPKKTEDPPDPKENVIYKTIKLWSPKLPFLGGIWYKVNVSDDEELQGKPEWTTAKPYDISIFANSEGMYLEPTDKEDDSGHLKLEFPLDGGMIKVSLNPKDALIFQIVGWIPIIGSSAELGENCAPYMDNIRRISNNDKEAVWKVIENLAYICEEIGETSFKEAVKYYAGNWYLLGNIEMYLNTIIDFNSDNPEGSYEWQIEVEPVNKIPVVSITSPTDGSTYTEGETIIFEGKATDPEDGVLTGDSLFWSLPSGKIIGTGESFSKNDLSVGTYVITLNAVDSQSRRGEYSVTINVTEQPDLRVNTVNLSKSSAQVGDSISVTFSVENNGGPVSGVFKNRVFLSTTQYGGGGQKIPLEDFSMSLDGISSKTETLNVTIPQVPAGDWYIGIFADATEVVQEENENNNINSASISIDTTNAPVITSDPVTTATKDEPYSYDVDATDADDDTRTYSLTTNPSGMTINSFTGLITWTPTATGDYNVTVKVSDGELSDTQSFTITVQNGSVILNSITVSPSTMSLIEGDSQTISSITVHYSDGSTADIAFDDCAISSENPGVAIVDTEGVIRAVAPGNATITIIYVEDFIDKTDTIEVTVTSTVTNQAPYIPNNPSPISGSTSIPINTDLSWTGEDPNPEDIVTYNVYFEANDSTPDLVVSNNQSSTTYNPGTLNYNTHYYWRIIAKDNHSNETPSPVWNFITESQINNPPNLPNTPSGPSSGKIGTSYSFSTSTTDPDGDNIAYMFDWGDGNISNWTSYISSGNIVNQLHSYSTKGTYYIKVKAKDVNGAESLWSNSHKIVIELEITKPVAPSKLSATTLSQNNIALAWQDNADNETGFKIERKTGTTGTFMQIATIGATAGTGSGVYYEDTGLTPGTTYCYRVRAYNSAGDSLDSNQDCATTDPSAPLPSATTGSATNITFNSATLNGTVNPNGIETGALFQWGTTASYGNLTDSQFLGSGTSNVNVPPTNVSGLSSNTIYHFRIVATNSAGGTTYGEDRVFTTCKKVTVDNTSGIGLNLHSSPDDDSPVVTGLMEGTQMSVIGGPVQADGYTWWNIKGVVGGILREGWSAVGEWLTPIVPQINSTVTVTYTGGNGLRLRDGAGLYGTSIITTLPEGTQMTVFDGPIQKNGYRWWALKGYVSGIWRTGWSAVGNWLVPNPRD